MPFRDEAYDLRVLFQARHYELSDGEKRKMEEDAKTLRRLVFAFPVADLHVEVVRHPRTGDFHLKTTLRLPGRTIFTGDRDVELHPAYERCLRKLVNKVKAYQESMDGKPARERLVQGVRSTVFPVVEPDGARI